MIELWHRDKYGNLRCNLCGQVFSLKGFKIHFGMKHTKKV